ncbi:Lymphoid-restricted membrane protein [Fukomys damarensis]|uniref:Lymphoid-restricted membrane protein n=1 Tax=Fukomys damarensis TaxID=885580 RepID=A0A091DZP0_FUKDA|nr:Lymphoid-restricted membrane protein [Fukomys damarensis]
MASARNVTEKRHNPVDSICRKIRAIQRREEISDPGPHTIRHQAGSLAPPPVPGPRFLRSESSDSSFSRPEVMLPRSPSASNRPSPEKARYSASPTSPSRPRSQRTRSCTSLIREVGSFLDRDSLDPTSGQSCSRFTPQDSVVRKLSLNEDGSTGVGKVIDYLRKTSSQDLEDRDLEELWTMLDPGKADPQVDVDAFHAAVKEWMACSRPKRDVSDLITYVADLHFHKQRLEEENHKFKLALETSEEANSQLTEDCAELRLQVKSARQAIMRTNLLKEELEEMKISLTALEEQKSMAEAQNKQLETENRALILKIRILQEENLKNALDIDGLEKKIEKLSETETEHQKDLRIEELKSSIIEYRSITEVCCRFTVCRVGLLNVNSPVMSHGQPDGCVWFQNLRGEKNELAYELQKLQQELILQKQLEAIKQLQEDAVNQEAILRKKVQETSEQLEEAEQQVKNQEQTAHCAREKAKSLPQELEEAILEQRNLHTINTELSNTRQTLEQKTRTLKTTVESLRKQLTKGRLHDLLFQSVLDEESSSHHDPLSSTAKIQQPLQEKLENGVEHSYAENLLQPREHLALPAPGQASSTENTVTSTDSGSEVLHMASGDLDSRSPCETQEERRSASTMIGAQGTSSAQESITCQGSKSKGKTLSNMEAKEEPKTIQGNRKECAAGETTVSSPPVTTGKLLNFRQSDNTSANEKEVEAEFLRLSLGFKCDWFTLEKRVKLEERSRDLAEENLKKEITNCLKLLESLTPLCEEDSQAQEIIKKLENSVTFLSQCTTRVASRAEMLGAINQESRVSKAVEVMIQHVENLKRMYAKEHAELEELKQVLLQNERSFHPLEDEDDCQIKKRSASLNSKASAMENERFSRRSSSWRILGSKQSEHRPSLHRFISTYSWVDAEEKCELKAKDDLESPGEETVEKTRKPSLSERKTNPSKWDLSSVPDTLASWATNLGTSVRKAKALWLSFVFIVLFAALMSLLTGQFFQKAVDAVPTQEGDSWLSLEHVLWPFTALQHNGPPPV